MEMESNHWERNQPWRRMRVVTSCSIQKGTKNAFKGKYLYGKRKLKKFSPDNVYFLSEECERRR